jgi:hypothetical protein
MPAPGARRRLDRRRCSSLDRRLSVVAPAIVRVWGLADRGVGLVAGADAWRGAPLALVVPLVGCARKLPDGARRAHDRHRSRVRQRLKALAPRVWSEGIIFSDAGRSKDVTK